MQRGSKTGDAEGAHNCRINWPPSPPQDVESRQMQDGDVRVFARVRQVRRAARALLIRPRGTRRQPQFLQR